MNQVSNLDSNSVETKPVQSRAVCKFTLRSIKDYGNDNAESRPPAPTHSAPSGAAFVSGIRRPFLRA